MHHAMSCAQENWYVDIPVLEYVEHFVHHVSRSVLFHVPMDHARQSVVKSVGHARKNVHGNVSIKNARKNVDQNATEPCVKKSVVKP